VRVRVRVRVRVGVRVGVRASLGDELKGEDVEVDPLAVAHEGRLVCRAG